MNKRDKRDNIKAILFVIIAFSITIMLYVFVTMMMARNKFNSDVKVCMGNDRSEASYEACFKALKNPTRGVEPEACQ